MNKSVLPISTLAVEPTAPSVEPTVSENGDAPSAFDEPIGQSLTSPCLPKKRLHSARVEHHVPGRIRVKIASAKNNTAVLNLYKALFSQLPGISKVLVNPETGSIIIHYDRNYEAEFQAHFHHSCLKQNVDVGAGVPGDDIEALASKIEAEASLLAQQSELARAAVDLFRTLDHQIREVSGNRIDLKVVIIGSLAGFTFAELGAEAATPMWVTLALFALNHFIELKNDAMQVAPPALPLVHPRTT